MLLLIQPSTYKVKCNYQSAIFIQENQAANSNRSSTDSAPHARSCAQNGLKLVYIIYLYIIYPHPVYQLGATRWRGSTSIARSAMLMGLSPQLDTDTEPNGVHPTQVSY